MIDLSHVIEDGLVTYPGLPAPHICDFLSREESRKYYTQGTEFQIARIELVANTGTYVDAPFHRYAEGVDIAGLRLDQLADLPGIVVRTDRPAIDASLFQGLPLRGRAVLVQTGWDRHWATPTYLSGHPFLTHDAAQYLVEQGAALVGIDSLNIDDITDQARPVHSVLLGAGIPIAEHLCNLKALPEEGFRFFAVPPRFRGVGTFPVRAFAMK